MRFKSSPPFSSAPGWLYTVEESDAIKPLSNIPHAFFAQTPVPVASCEFVPDALQAMLEAKREGKIVITRYADLSEKMRKWIRDTTFDEYRNAQDAPDYRYFLKKKFPFLNEAE